MKTRDQINEVLDAVEAVIQDAEIDFSDVTTPADVVKAQIELIAHIRDQLCADGDEPAIEMGEAYGCFDHTAETTEEIARRDEGMFSGRDLARVVPAGVDLTVGSHVLVVSGPERGRVGTALSWRAASDGIGWQVSFAWPPWVTGRDLREAIRSAMQPGRGADDYGAQVHQTASEEQAAAAVTRRVQCPPGRRCLACDRLGYHIEPETVPGGKAEP